MRPIIYHRLRPWLLSLISLCLTAGCSDDATPGEDSAPNPISLVASTRGIAENIPAANVHFCFWKVELFNSEGVAKTFNHYFDAWPESTLDQLYLQPYNTPAYYPPNYASIYGYAFAEDKELNLTVDTTNYAPIVDDNITATFDETNKKVLQTVRFTTDKGETPDPSVWGQIYVTRSQEGLGYVTGSLQDSYSEKEPKLFYFTRDVTRLKIRLKRSTNISGDDVNSLVSNIYCYVPNRCIPTQLDMTLEDGYRAVYADSATEAAGKIGEKEVLYYGGYLSSDEYREAGNLYLLLGHYTINRSKGGEQLPMEITATYGTTTKHFKYTLNLTGVETKTSAHFLPNEVYTVRIVFDLDALIISPVFEDWENGPVTYLPFEANAGTGEVVPSTPTPEETPSTEETTPTEETDPDNKTNPDNENN